MCKPFSFLLAASWLAIAGICAVKTAAAGEPTARPPILVEKPAAIAAVKANPEAERVVDGAEEFKPANGATPRALATTALGEQQEWLKDPFRHIESDMAGVVADLGKAETHIPATQSQPRILSRLDVLVTMLEKACKKGGGGAAGNNPNRPANTSTLGGGPKKQGPLRNPGDSRRDWASLTPKEREKILQAQSQGFPAGYEDLLAEYFRRLAQGETRGEVAAEAASGKSGAAGRGTKPADRVDQ